jgi:tetratricopeptide (TPR) repeat protein
LSTNAAGSTERVPLIAGVVLLFAATLLAYWPAVHGAFLFDDDAMVIASALVKASDGLWRMWFTTEALDYWPVTNSSLWIEWRLWGEDPTGYHITNVVLHACSALLLWRILRLLSIPGAWIAAMLFALHPVNVQAVAWVAQRKNTLSLVFFLLSILWFIRTMTPDLKVRGSVRHAYWVSLAAFLLAMLSKGSVAILPAILVLLIWWTRGRVTRRHLVTVAPFLLIAVTFTVVNIWFQQRMPGGVRDVNFLERLLGAGGVIWFYLGKALAPVRQAFIYAQWDVSQSDPIWWVPTPAAIAVTAVLWWKRRIPAVRALLFAWAFFCIALLPVLGLTDVYFMIYSLVADHYQYIAILAVAALVGAGLGNFELRTSNLKLAGRAVALILIATLGVMTWKQAHLYANGETLYRASLEVNPDAWPLRNNLGAILLERDSNDEALQHLRAAMRVNPSFRQAHNNICSALARLRLMDEAIVECRRAIQVDPGVAVSHYSLGMALMARGEIAQARAEFEAALRLDPASVQARSYLAELLLETGNPAASAANYREVLRLRPDSAFARAGLGRALAELGDAAGAEAVLREAIRLDPSVADTHRDLADVLLQLGRVEEAVTEYRQALSRDARSPEAHNNLGVALARAGRTAEAVSAFQAAIALDPSFVPARENLEKVSRRR